MPKRYLIFSPQRTAAYVAIERHDGCRKGGKGYPCRAIRTTDYMHIYNFEPTRWPSGSPDASVCARETPYGEIDGSPTKTLMMDHRNEHGIARLAELAFGMRPAEELLRSLVEVNFLLKTNSSRKLEQIVKKLEQFERFLFLVGDQTQIILS